jgi:uncharacterized membrane protein HdeD (DUF308 family)
MNKPAQTFTNAIKATGIFFILAGLSAFAIAILVPRLIGSILAILLIVAGAVRLTYALISRFEVGFWLRLANGVLDGVAGLVLLSGISRPYLSIASLLGAVLILEGLLELVLATQLPPGLPRQWLYISSGIAFVLGVLFAAELGVGTIWLLGLMAGLSLIIPGIWFVFISREMQQSADA